MKKIMFNDKYGLTQAVLEGRKTQTRRMLNPTMFFQRLETYEGWSNEDFSAWKRLCNRRLYEAQGDMLQQMFDYALSSSRYKVGEVVAVAQKYKDIALDVPVELAAELIKQPGWNNKMFVRADLMPHHIRITNIRVERLRDISEEDCLKEGIWRDDNVGIEGTTYWYHGLANSSFRTAKEAYAALIDKISGKGTWEGNPWVFVYDFELIK
ncbi:hypothetical protein [Leyella stercorea]|uniref:hypothetical protein n=1 Tax=Leyella stercorea TaxID=363265 RepID=UPI00266C624F|nr:hypothetical protein [Leyella stercorea]